MNSDFLRGATARGRGTASVPAAGYTGNASLVTDWIDTAGLSTPIVVLGYVEADANLSGTLSIQSATDAAGTGAATVNDTNDFPGGRDAQGVNSTGGVDFAVSNALDAAISYNGDARYIRGHLSVANASNAAVSKEVTLVAIGMPTITPSR